MMSWRNQSFWSKVATWAWVAVLVLVSGGSDLSGVGDGPSGRKRVFSPGFVMLCILVALVELVTLNYLYGARR